MRTSTYAFASRGAAAGLLLLGAIVAPLGAARAGEPLTETQLRHLDEAYVSAAADFGHYRRVLIDPVQVSFRRDWMRNLARERDLSRRIDADDARAIAEHAQRSFDEVYAASLEHAGYARAAAPAPDVLRLTPSLEDYYVNAPDTPSSARTRTYTREAGSATLVLELRDAIDGTLLGRFVDRRRTPSRGGSATDIDAFIWTTEVSTRSDFAALYRTWARVCARSLDALAARSALADERSGVQQ
jgi:hypothetical protein